MSRLLFLGLFLALFNMACSEGVPDFSGDSSLNGEEPYCNADRQANSPYANSGEAGIDGLSEAAAYSICNISQFLNLSARSFEWSYHFSQKTNINMNGVAGFSPIGNQSIPFAGSYNGNFHLISDLNYSTGSSKVGVFGVLNVSGKILNVSATNVNMTGASNVGGLVGYNAGVIRRSMSSGTVTGTSMEIGGLVGWNQGTIEDSYSNANVNGSQKVGGLVGINYNSTSSRIVRTYATGDVTASNNIVGGLVGYNSYRTLHNSFSTGNVTGFHTDNSRVGLVIGYNLGTGNVNVYGSSTALCTNTGTGGCNSFHTTADLDSDPNYFKDPQNLPLSNWDFMGPNDGVLNVWSIFLSPYPLLNSNASPAGL